MGCGSSLDAMYDDPMPVVVFGATGMLGGAVAKALLRDRRFQVKAVTRTPTTDTARKLAEEALPYTALRMPFYYENFMTVFKPHKVKPGVYAVVLPMGDQSLDCMSVKDVGRCVVKVLLSPRAHVCRVLPLTAEKLTVQQMTDTLNRHVTDRKFVCPKIRIKDYQQFKFEGSQDIAAMFQFFLSGQEARDGRFTRRVQGSLCSFDRWVEDNKELLADSMDAPD
ncbi:nmrA-like family domain-containing protein 1 [Babylonia areolata]|uniref:nmrA-like family domain-containing protein 1 n=1 Tax=Babylonia areolata TaxID=304850 RepID=UPI003FD2BF36